jgi:hypothetical protein
MHAVLDGSERIEAIILPEQCTADAIECEALSVLMMRAVPTFDRTAISDSQW